jgi:hypothetical protein
MTPSLKPTPRLIRHRLREAYGWLFTFSGVTGLISGRLVLSTILAVCWQASSSPWKWEMYVGGALAALAYCVPWGAFSAHVEPGEESHM